MNLLLIRDISAVDGIFGRLLLDSGDLLCVTLEHAYLEPDGSYTPKIPTGKYICVRGLHRLPKMVSEFSTFEITNVFKYTGLLFHVGNVNRDSSGCILLGKDIVEIDSNERMINHSKATFKYFMTKLSGINSFDIEIK